MRNLISQIFSGLRLRLLVLVALACAPLAGLTLYSAWQERYSQVAGWKQRSQDMMKLAIREEEKVIGQTRQLLLALAESSQAQSGNRRDCKKLVDGLFASYPRYANLGVIETNGEFLASALTPAGAANQADRKFFRRTLETRAFAIGDYPLGHTVGKPTISFGYPVLAPSGQVRAVVFATLDLDWFNRFESELLAQLPIGATWTAIDRNGTILVRYPAPEEWIGRPLPESALLKTVFGQNHGVVEAPDSEGVPGFYAFASMHSKLVPGDVVTILGIPRQVLFAGADRMLIRSLAGLGVAAALALALGWLGSNLLVLRPVKALAHSSARLTAGDLSARMELPHGKDEFGQVTRAFDQMAQALEEREKQRQDAVETLETREEMMRELPLLPAAVYVCGMSGMIELYNRTAVELWGCDAADNFATKRFCGSHQLYRPDGTPLPHDDSPMAEVLRTGIPVRNCELVIERPDGARVTVLANVVPVRNQGGQMVGAVNCLQDITERKLAEEKLKEYSNNLQTLSHRLVEAQESERRHIARELHDEIGQTLTVAEMNLQAAMQSPDAGSLAPRLKAAAEAVERVLEQVRDLSLNLRPSMLDDLGLDPALRWYTNRQASLAGLQAEFRADPLENRLDPVIETECFRVAQEALTNVVRHARARAVTVELRKTDGHLDLSVRDDGIGFDVADLRQQAVRGASLGLLSMEERAALAGGGLEFKSSPGHGTEVHAWFPLKWLTPQS